VLSKYDLPWKPTGLKRDATIADAWKGGFKTETQVKRSKTAEKWIKKTRPGDDLRRTFNLHVQPDDMQHGMNGRVVGRPPFAWKRLRKEGLSHVITGGPNFVHPKANRFLTVEEQAALCGYPKWYKFSGSPSAQYPQIGKAVMPPVAEYIARIVAEGLKKKKKPLVLIPEQVTIWRDKIEREDSNMAHKDSGFVAAKLPPVIKKHTVLNKQLGVKKITVKGSGFRIREMLLAGWDNDRILLQIKKEFPESKAKASDVYWNKRKLQDQGGTP
jgi:hypothetical protein